MSAWMRYGYGVSKRSYGSGRLFARVDSGGRETWYGSWHVGGRRIKRRLGVKRRAGAADGLTRTQAEAELRRRMGVDVVVAGPSRETVDRCRKYENRTRQKGANARARRARAGTAAGRGRRDRHDETVPRRGSN